MHIVFLIDQVHTHGGIERVLSIKANYLANLTNYKISIITSEQKGKKHCYNFNSNIQFYDLGINYHRHKSYFHPKNIIKLPLHIRRLRYLIKKLMPDAIVVCSHSTDTFFVPLLFKKIPTIKEFHYSKFIEKARRDNPRSIFNKWFMGYSDFIEAKYNKLIVLNKDEATYYKSNNVEIIPNPTTFYPKLIPKKNRERIVIAAGRIAHVKGFDRLIEIWSLIKNNISDWELHIYGEGTPSYLDMLRGKLREYGLEKQVFLKGQTNDIQGKLLNASIYAMTSHNECFPLILLEAQACGLPVISFDCPHGPRNIIQPQSGILVPNGDIKMFAQQLLGLIQNPEKLARMSIKGRENVFNYRIDEVLPLWTRMFHNLVKK